MRTRAIVARDLVPGQMLIQGTRPGDRQIRRIKSINIKTDKSRTFELSNGLGKPTSELTVRNTTRLRTQA